MAAAGKRGAPGGDENPAPLKASMVEDTLRARTKARLDRITEVLGLIDENLSHEKPILCCAEKLELRGDSLLPNGGETVVAHGTFTAAASRRIRAFYRLGLPSAGMEISLPCFHFTRYMKGNATFREIHEIIVDFFERFPQNDAVNAIAVVAEEMLVLIERVYQYLIDEVVCLKEPLSFSFCNDIHLAKLTVIRTDTLLCGAPGWDKDLISHELRHGMLKGTVDREFETTIENTTLSGICRESEDGQRYVDNAQLGERRFIYAPKICLKDRLTEEEVGVLVGASYSIKTILKNNHISSK